jgi:hypothetical protein
VSVIGKKINWQKIKAEYVAGNISQRKLAQKHHVPVSTLQARAHRGGWNAERKAASVIVTQKAIEKTSEAVENNALLVAEIKRKGLETVNRLLEQFNELNCTERRDITKTSVDIKRLRDITAAFKDLTDDMPKESNTEPVRIVIDV